MSDLAFVHSIGSDLTVLRQGTMPADPFSLIGTIDFDYATNFPGSHGHPSHTLAVRATPGQADHFDLFTNLGAASNFAETDPNDIVFRNTKNHNTYSESS